VVHGFVKKSQKPSEDLALTRIGVLNPEKGNVAIETLRHPATPLGWRLRVELA
jgi:hypothetical protein